jgi:transglutaminase-like putative cysteine protease
MKKQMRVLILVLVFMMLSMQSVFAKDKYLETRSYTYTNDGKRADSRAFMEVFVGQKNAGVHEKDEYIKVNPTPDEMITDDFGNMYAHYDLSTYKPGRSITVTIEKLYEVEDYNEEISVRSESTVNPENSLFAKPQEKVDSENAEIIAKAKELAYGISSDYKRAKAIFEFVNVNMKYNAGSSQANQGSLAALQSMSGVCEEYATLYAALCRAIEIPCKVVEGFRLEQVVDTEATSYIDPATGLNVDVPETYRFNLIPHVWNEIYLDDYGWVPVDTCVVYSGKNTSKTAYFDAFCKMKGADYVANGLYNALKPAIQYSSNFKEVSSVERVVLLDEDGNPILSSGDADIDVIVKPKKSDHKFLDLANYGWAEDAINTLYDMNVIKGYTDEEYGPAGNITRIEFITMLARVLKNLNYTPDTSGVVYYYLDYDKTHYSKREYDFLMRCLEENYPKDRYAVGYYAMSNIFGESLQMNKPITRAEVVALMDSFLKNAPDYQKSFNDAQGHRFYSSIVKSATNGLIVGYEDGTFRPNNAITRAEIAVILDRYIGAKEITY